MYGIIGVGSEFKGKVHIDLIIVKLRYTVDSHRNLLLFSVCGFKSRLRSAGQLGCSGQVD